jgi:hypothetical protein
MRPLITIDKLKKWGHDVVSAKELGIERASDEDLLKAAREANRLEFYIYSFTGLISLCYIYS